MRLMPSVLALRSSRDRRQQGPDGQNLIEPLGSNCIQEGQRGSPSRRGAADIVGLRSGRSFPGPPFLLSMVIGSSRPGGANVAATGRSLRDHQRPRRGTLRLGRRSRHGHFLADYPSFSRHTGLVRRGCGDAGTGPAAGSSFRTSTIRFGSELSPRRRGIEAASLNTRARPIGTKRLPAST